jgi:hypothetical protein
VEVCPRKLAPVIHRTLCLYQFIKEEFILSMSLRLMRFYFSLIYCFANPHEVPYSHAVLEACLELLCCIFAQDLYSQEGRVRPSGNWLQGNALVLCGVQSCVAA